MMNIVEAWPPNIDAIRAALDISAQQPIFTYGDTIYNPYKCHIDPSLMAHEETHERQQAAIGVDAWWDRYLREPEFRADQEIAAYRRQFRVLRKHYRDRNALARWLHETAALLAGPMYGGCLPHTVALVRIKK